MPQAIRHHLFVAIALCTARCTSPPPVATPPERARTDIVLSAETTPVSSAALPRDPQTMADRHQWRAVLAWPDDCEDAFQASHAGDDAGVQVHTIADHVSLLAVTCAAGAYQPSTIYVRLNESGRRPVVDILTFPTYQSDDGHSLTQAERRELWGEPTFDPVAHELSVLSLSRQTGDCGVWMRYALGVGSPRLVDARARLPCPTRRGAPVATQPGQPPPGWTRVSR